MTMDKFLKSCKRCLNPKVTVILVIVIIGLFIIVPMIGVASFIVALPILGCTIMCGAMAFFMREDKVNKD